MARFALVRKKECWSLTWRGRLLLLIIIFMLGFISMKTIHPFLAKNEPIDAKLLVVEGFITDYALEECMKIFNEGQYNNLLITGKKRIQGAYLDMYPNDGEYSAATLEKLGFDRSKIMVVTVGEDILRDRTYASAEAVHDWMIKNNWLENFNLATLGCHARRSQLLFREAFDDSVDIGIIAIENLSYDPQKWWTNSNGFREVNKEFIAWVYARFFFFPSK